MDLQRTDCGLLDSDPSPLAPTNNQTSVDLILKSTEEDLKTWPRRYALGI